MISLNDLTDSMEHRKRRRKATKKRGRKTSKRKKSRKSKGKRGGKSKYSGVKVRAHMKAGSAKFGCYVKSVRNGRGGRSMRGYCSKSLG